LNEGAAREASEYSGSYSRDSSASIALLVGWSGWRQMYFGFKALLRYT
jgi:hypothetical protein